jgi:hypothetical protein
VACTLLVMGMAQASGGLLSMLVPVQACPPPAHTAARPAPTGPWPSRGHQLCKFLTLPGVLLPQIMGRLVMIMVSDSNLATIDRIVSRDPMIGRPWPAPLAVCPAAGPAVRLAVAQRCVQPEGRGAQRMAAGCCITCC